MQCPATVIIGNHTQGLGLVRSAAQAGGDVWVVNDKWLSLARCSRYLTGYRRVAHGTLLALHQPEVAATLVEVLLSLPFQGNAVLFGVNEDINRFIHEHRDALRARYLIPDTPLNRIFDKFVFNSLVPEAARIETHLASQVEWAKLVATPRYLLKGRSGNAFRELTGAKAIALEDIDAARRAELLQQLSPDTVLLQAIITTHRPVRSVCAFSVGGIIQSWFGYDKLRQHPNQFGTGTYLRSTPVDDLRPVAEQILQTLKFTGISEIEFIHDASSNSYRVIEMNPRAWKSVHFATQCGRNLVALYLRHLSGQPTVPSRDRYPDHCHWVDLATDLPQLWRERRWPRYEDGCFECTWTGTDPLPAVMLWTLFPVLALENFIAQRRKRQWRHQPHRDLGPAPARNNLTAMNRK